MRGARLALTVVCGVACAALARSPGVHAQERPLTVAAASDLQGAFPEIGRAFEQRTGRKVTFSFASSGALAKQIASGAPFDAFCSANEQFVDLLATQGLVVGAGKRVYAIGRLALVVNRRSGLQATQLRHVLKRQIRHIAIANPEHAPYGKAAQEAMKKASVWETVKGKVVLAESVRQAVQYVQTGNADVGLVALSVAVSPEITYTLVERSLHAPIRQTGAVVTASQQRRTAEQFLDFVTGPDGQAILARYGFEAPPKGPRTSAADGRAVRGGRP